MIRAVASFVLEAVGVLLLALALGLLFGWAWSLIPVAVYVIFTGVMLGGARR